MTEDSIGTVGLVATELASALKPLEDHLTPDGILSLFNELGIELPVEIIGKQGLSTTLPAAKTAVEKLPGLVTALRASTDQGLTAILEATGELLDALIAIFKALDAIAAAIKAVANELPGVTPGDVEAFALDFARRLLEYLVVIYLEGHLPRLTAFLALLGVVEIEAIQDLPPSPAHVPYVRRQLQLDNISKVIRSTDDFMLTEYGWGSAGFDGRKLLSRLNDLLYSFAVPARLTQGTDTTPARVDVLLFSLAADRTVAPPGLTAALTFGLQKDFTVQFPFILEGWRIEVGAKGKLDAGLAATVQPPGKLTLRPPSGTLDGEASLSVVGERPSPNKPDPFRVLRIPGVGRIEAARVRVKVGSEFKFDAVRLQADGEPFVELRLEGAKLVFGADPNDGFLAKTIPSNGVAFDFDIGIGWSQSRGVFFSGSAGIETTISIGAQLGPVFIDTLHIGVGVDGDGLDLEISATLSVEIGPITASVDRIGLESLLKFSRGNLGPLDLDTSFKFPTGIGIDVDAGPVSGGGFLFIDKKAGRYAGACELSVYGVAVKAFGVIDTKFPDGTKGFSFIIVISAEFTPIQLGFGFTLLGVGGMVGINRTLDQDALRKAVRSGGLDNILFPHDVIGNAPAIIHDLTALFPASEGHYVFGPMAKIGWGTPTVIDAEIGIILVLPDRLLALLGEVHSTLPSQTSALVKINISIGGVLDFPQKKFSLDGSLHDSKVGSFTLSGDMAMRLSWGANPAFALSVGGFNPAFKPPAGFPALARIAVDMGLGGNPSIRHEGYLAVTSNTLQVGARSQITAHGGGIDLDGHLGWDALFVLSPFSFTATFDAGVSVKFHGHGIGVHLHGEISGPSPWRVKGEVCVSILFWDACLGFDKTFGGEPRVELPALDPFLGSPAGAPLEAQEVVGLKNALEDQRNWSSVAPAGSFTVVTLAQRKEGEEAPPPVDPLGAAVLHQRVVPLNRKITLYAGVKPLGPGQYNVDSVTVSNGVVVSKSYVQDDFAPAAFKKMSDAERLSGRSFEPMDAGVKLASDEVKVGGIVPHDVTYDTLVVGGPPGTTTTTEPRPGPTYTLTDNHLKGMTARSAAALHGMRVAGAERFVDSTAQVKVALVRELFVVAQRSVLAAATGFTPTLSRTAATLALEAAVAADPTQAALLHVVPFHELTVPFPKGP